MNEFLRFSLLMLVSFFFSEAVKAQDINDTSSFQESTQSVKNDFSVEELLTYEEPFSLLYYDWEAVPEYHATEQKEQSTFQKYHQALEYFYDEKGDFRVLELTHHIVNIHNESTLRKFNKIILPLQAHEKLVGLKARSIQTDGKIVELDLSQLRETDGNGYFSSSTRFPIEGATVGSQIEYFYITEKPALLSGHYTFPVNTLLKEVSFSITTPANILFTAKSYNGLPDVILQTDVLGRNQLSFLTSNLQTTSSQSTLGEGSLMRLHYRFSHLITDPIDSTNNWQKIANKIAEVVYPLLIIDEKRRIRSILKEIEADKNTTVSEQKKIQRIENFLKNSIRLNENISHDSYSLLASLEAGMSDSYGMLRLFGAFFQEADIDHRLVGTSDKKYFTFDEEFPSWDFIHAYLYYFPSQNNYLMPTKLSYRYGYIPYSLAKNKGIFIKPPVLLGENIVAYSDIRTINYTPIQTQTNTFYKVRFDENMSHTKINLKRNLTGYAAIDYHSDYLMSDEPEKTLAQRFDIRIAGKAITERVDIVQVNDKYENMESISPDYFQVEGKLSSHTLVEQAGSTYLFKLGSLLDAHPKSFNHKVNIERGYPESFKTIIEIEIPEGYFVRNREALKKQVWSVERNQMMMLFRTNITHNATMGILRVEIEEFYRNGVQAKDELSAFERINVASVNFSNAMVILQKMK